MVTVGIDWREPRSGKSMNERFVLSGSVDDYRIRTLNIRHGSFTCRLFVFLAEHYQKITAVRRLPGHLAVFLDLSFERAFFCALTPLLIVSRELGNWRETASFPIGRTERPGTWPLIQFLPGPF
jgi:hypothetical protein